MNIQNFNSTDIGLVRKANEDFMGQSETPNGHLYVVCDGMGGHIGGAIAAKIGVECIIEYLNKKVDSNVGELLIDAVKFANTQIFAKAIFDKQLKGMGATCVILLVTPDGFAWTCHVGDSRIYLYRNEKLSRLTKDHSYVQFLVDSGELKEEDAEKHPNKNQILRALGSDEDIKPELCAVPFRPENNDIFLLCSDGLTGMVNDENISKVIINSNLSELSDKLIEAALAGGGRDNVTVSIVEVSGMKQSSTIPSGDLNKIPLKVKIKNKRNILLISFLILVLGLSSTYYFGNTKQQDLISVKSGNLDSSKSLNKVNSKNRMLNDSGINDSSKKEKVKSPVSINKEKQKVVIDTDKEPNKNRTKKTVLDSTGSKSKANKGNATQSVNPGKKTKVTTSSDSIFKTKKPN